MRIGGVGIEAFVGHFVNHVGTVGENLVFHAVEVVADYQRFEFHAQLGGELTPFGEEFEAHIGHFAILKLAIYDEIILILHDVLVRYVDFISRLCGWR